MRLPLIVVGIFALFVGLRLLTISTFPVFNDEAIYTQYSQLIHSNFKANAFVSVHNRFGDWKPPLQYWLGAIVVDRGDNPLLAVRLLTLGFSCLGLIGVYVFTANLFDERTGLIAAVLYAVCPAVLFYNIQFVAESFLFSLAPWFYWLVLRAMGRNRIQWTSVAGAVIVATVMLLIKQSGLVLLALGALLPLAMTNDHPTAPADGRERQRAVSQLISRYVTFVLIAGAAVIAEHAAIPAGYFADAARFNARWVFTPLELLELPFEAWFRNLRMVADVYWYLYTPLVAVLFVAFGSVIVRRRNRNDVILGGMLLAGSVVVILGLRGFNEYMYHTAVIAVLIPILARTFASALEDAKCTLTRMRWIGGATAGLVVILAASWVYQIGYMAIAPGGYLLSRTPWMRENYVENWPTGFGVKEVVQFLKEQPGPGIVFVDPQWGNPATSLEVFGKQYPQLIVTSVTTQFLSGDGAATIKKECEPLYKTRLVIFSEGSRNQPGRAAWQRNVLERLCSDKQEIRPQPRQMPILICRF